MVTRTFHYQILLEKEADGFHVATTAPHYSYSNVVNHVQEQVTDFSNAPGDNLAQLGDISNDVFHTRNLAGRAPYPTSDVPYIGSMAKPSDGFVYKDAAGYYFLLTNKPRFTRKSMRGELLDVQDKPFVLGKSAQAATVAAQSTHKPHASGDDSVSPLLCFREGTLITTATGEKTVETLAPGDMVVTACRDRRPVRWVGHRTIAGSSADFWPIRVAAGAFGGGLPRRDLWLSPGHPVLVGADADDAGGHLVPIMCLINGTTVRRMPVDIITYWHVELDAHDILLAEGLAAESYLELGDRAFFTQAADTALTNPDLVPADHGRRCRPVAIDGIVVERERQRLDATFAERLAAAAAWPVADAEPAV